MVRTLRACRHWVLLEVVRTDVRFLLVKGRWQQCGEPSATGEDCKTSLEAVAGPNEVMVTLQKVIWFVRCVLTVKPRGFIGGFDVSLEGISQGSQAGPFLSYRMSGSTTYWKGGKQGLCHLPCQ